MRRPTRLAISRLLPAAHAPEPGAAAILPVLLLLGGCSGLGHFFADTETLPGQNPNAATGVSENVQRARGHEPATEAMLPEPGDVWPGPPQPLPTLSDVAHGGLGADALGGTMPRGASMSLGEQDAVRGGVPVGRDFSGPGLSGGLSSGGPSGGGPSGGGLSGSSLSESVPDPATRFHARPGASGAASGDTGGNIVIPNGDGTSTVISPDGSVRTVKGTPP